MGGVEDDLIAGVEASFDDAAVGDSGAEGDVAEEDFVVGAEDAELGGALHFGDGALGD